MDDMKKNWIIRIVAGGFIGMAVLCFIGGLFNAARFSGRWEIEVINPALIQLTGSALPAALIQFTLYFLLGAGAGVATLPFAEEGEELLIRSVLHFAYTAMLFSILVWLTGWAIDVPMWLTQLFLLALLYALIWFGRWLAWWFEVDEIREKLGLTLPPSPLKWRESLPHIGYAALLCFVVPALLAVSLFRSDDPSPGAVTILTPLVAIASCPPGVSLGKRRGFCPLYPISCGAFYLAALFGLYYTDRYHDPTTAFLVCTAAVFAAALAGTLSGAARYKHKQRKGNLAHE